MKTAKSKTLIFSLSALVVLGACSNELATVSDTELADTNYECQHSQGQSPGMAIRCDNIERECASRRDQGRYIC